MALGIDIGRSGVKVCAAGTCLPVFPGLACPALPIDDAAEAQNASADTVMVNGAPWFIGRTAQLHGRVSPRNDASFEMTQAYRALLHGALARARAIGASADRICLGVPAEAGSPVRNHVAKIARAAAGDVRVRVVAQPAGALAAVAAVDETVLARCVAVVDVGRYSTDLAISDAGRPVSGSFISLPGVRLAVDRLAAALRGELLGSSSFELLESALRTGFLPHSFRRLDVGQQAREACQALHDAVDEAIARLLTLRPDIDVLILAGGGIDLLDLSKLPPHVVAPDARHAVARGLEHIALGL